MSEAYRRICRRREEIFAAPDVLQGDDPERGADGVGDADPPVLQGRGGRRPEPSRHEKVEPSPCEAGEALREVDENDLGEALVVRRIVPGREFLLKHAL